MIDVAVEATIADRVQGAAAAAGLPVEIALYVVVEAERALAEAVAVVGVSHDALVTFLDAAASGGDERRPRNVLTRKGLSQIPRP